MSSSTKPYLLRALYEWCVDNDQTPHIVAWVNEQTRVPMQYVRDNEIVLNIGPSASHNLIIDNEWVSFSARFGGRGRGGRETAEKCRNIAKSVALREEKMV